MCRSSVHVPCFMLLSRIRTAAQHQVCTAAVSVPIILRSRQAEQTYLTGQMRASAVGLWVRQCLRHALRCVTCNMAVRDWLSVLLWALCCLEALQAVHQIRAFSVTPTQWTYSWWYAASSCKLTHCLELAAPHRWFHRKIMGKTGQIQKGHSGCLLRHVGRGSI